MGKKKKADTKCENNEFFEQSSFRQIRRGLDSSYAYLVFELTARGGDSEGLARICRILDAPGAGVLERIFYRDDDTGRLLLVARLGTDSDRLWKERMLTEALPGGITFYFYERVR